jgi:hypothetical protein
MRLRIVDNEINRSRTIVLSAGDHSDGEGMTGPERDHYVAIYLVVGHRLQIDKLRFRGTVLCINEGRGSDSY